MFCRSISFDFIYFEIRLRAIENQLLSIIFKFEEFQHKTGNYLINEHVHYIELKL